jgi:hypothetical protein
MGVKALVIAALMSAFVLCITAAGAAPESGTCAEKHIHVASMGSTDDAKQFTFLLEQQLSKRGFSVVPTPEAADAILSGAVTTKDEQGNSFESLPVAYVTATLVSKAGQELWRGYFKPHPGFHPPTKSSLEIRASELAKDLASMCSRGWSKK